MPLVYYCKKCKTEVQVGESCAYCGGKLSKQSEMLSFGTIHVPVRDWFCWNELLRIALPVLCAVTAVALLFELVAGGTAAVEKLLREGFLGTMLVLLGVALALFYVLLRLQGGERIHYVLDKQGIHAWTYLQNPNPLQLYTRLLTPETVVKFAQDDHALPDLTLIRHQTIVWQDIQRVRLWRENAVVLLYKPSWWQVMHVNCPIEEWTAVEQMTRQKLKPRKEVVRRVKIEG